LLRLCRQLCCALLRFAAQQSRQGAADGLAEIEVGGIEALFRLYEGTIKALLKLY
jgi:hypothetical protein